MNDGTETTPATRIFSNFATIETPEAPSITVDFEQFQDGDYPASTFSIAEPPRTVGIATFSGGQLLNATTNLPVNQSVVYGTANVCTGCSSTITIAVLAAGFRLQRAAHERPNRYPDVHRPGH